MNGKLIVLGIITLGVAGWLLQGWYAANKAPRANESTANTTVVPASSSTSPETYVATSTGQQVVLDIHPDHPVATLRGLGYGALPLRATSTSSGEIYFNTNERLRAVLVDNQLRVMVADTELFFGVRATTTPTE